MNCTCFCTYHSFAALVLGDLMLRIGVVDLVDDERRIGNLLRHPTDIFLLCLSDHDLECIIATRGLGHAIAELGY